MGRSAKGEGGQRKERRPESAPTKPARRSSESELVEKVIEKIEEDLRQRKLKGSVGDLIRLLQLRKELKEDEPREIKVSWVEPHEEGHAGEE